MCGVTDSNLVPRVVVGAAACLPRVQTCTPAGSSPTYRSNVNGRVYRFSRLSYVRVLAFALVAFVSIFLACPVFAQAMPNVTPVEVNPVRLTSSGGIETKVTYEMRFAANDAVNGARAASYVTRGVEIAGPTMGGILRGVVAGGVRLSGWVGAAMLAYDAYKWYTNDQGQLMSPGESHPSVDCSGGDYFSDSSWHGGTTCSLAYMQVLWEGYFRAFWPGAVSYDMPPLCMPSPGSSCATYWTAHFSNGASATAYIRPFWHVGGGHGVDPAYSTDPMPVTDAQLGDLVQQHPEWWHDMLTDPVTGQPLITPEIADDIDNLKHDIAPDYGVDPQTLPETSPDPKYQEGQADPRPQSLPPFCQYAARVCEHYDFVEKNWPFPDPSSLDQSKGPDDPATKVFSDDDSTGLEHLDSSGFLGGGVCPGLAPIDYMGHEIDFGDGICQTADLLGRWLVGIAYAMAALIALRVKSGG